MLALDNSRRAPVSTHRSSLLAPSPHEEPDERSDNHQPCERPNHDSRDRAAGKSTASATILIIVIACALVLEQRELTPAGRAPRSGITLKLQEFTAPSVPIQTGIPQGSPISLILYLFYNADLIEACKTEETEAVGYIDDVSTLPAGPLAQRNCKTLKKIHEKAEQWAVKHGSYFSQQSGSPPYQHSLPRHRVQGPSISGIYTEQ
ncbi:hypothetical protein F1880_008431 [Penicillium rolfsii]|nr:hypothetical protein F1880_008431 [Penicillium rolfsii]